MSKQAEINRAWEQYQANKTPETLAQWRELTEAHPVPVFAGLSRDCGDCGEDIDAHVPQWENPYKEIEAQFNRPLSEDNRLDRVVMEHARIGLEEFNFESFGINPL